MKKKLANLLCLLPSKHSVIINTSNAHNYINKITCNQDSFFKKGAADSFIDASLQEYPISQ